MDKEERERTERAKKEEERVKLEDKKENNLLKFEIKHLELHKELHLQKTRQAVCRQLKTWDDCTDPITYLDNFELVMQEVEIPRVEWVTTLQKQLTGKALRALQEEVSDMKTPYPPIKIALLNQMGATAGKARRMIRTLVAAIIYHL